MKRRQALTAMLSALVWPLSVLGQDQRLPVIGVLVTHPPLTDLTFVYLHAGLKKFGYIDGKNVKIEVRTALGQLERIPGLAKELVRLRPAAILVVNELAVRAVKQATTVVPIVMVGYAVSDPVALKLIESYARPGGNVTGLFSVDATLLPKRLELLRDALPGISRVAAFWDSNFGRYQIDELQRAAQVIGIELKPIDVRRAEDLEPAFTKAKRDRAEALISTFSPVFWIHKVHLAQMALAAKLPSISEFFQYVEAGGLMSYGSFGPQNWERAGYYVDRLLKGAKVSDLPVEHVSTYTLAVNLKTAKALGLKIPESILVRADQVIR